MFGKAEKRELQFLERDFGFEFRDFRYSFLHFGNFVAEYVRSGVTLNIWRDREQVFVELIGRDAEWRDKDDIPEEMGITRDRHPTINGLWSGYEMGNQISELKTSLPRLIAAVSQPEGSAVQLSRYL